MMENHTKIDDVEMTIRAANVLRDHGCRTVEDTLSALENGKICIGKTLNMGRKTYLEIVNAVGLDAASRCPHCGNTIKPELNG